MSCWGLDYTSSTLSSWQLSIWLQTLSSQIYVPPTLPPFSYGLPPPYYPPQPFTTWAIAVSPLSAWPWDAIFLWGNEWTRFWYFYIDQEGSKRMDRRFTPSAFCVLVTIWVCFSITFVILWIVIAYGSILSSRIAFKFVIIHLFILSILGSVIWQFCMKVANWRKNEWSEKLCMF